MRYLAALLLAVLSISPAYAAGDPAAGEVVFKKCAQCHMIGPDAHTKVGPELNGLIGRPSGSIDGFNYSDAMKNAHLTWDVTTFETYIADPKALVPGTRMSFGGLKDQQDIKDLVAYLSQFAADGSKMP
ncbi:MAG: cytochrome c family protein [Devosia sp.]|nr:cytochrome c family protein [Devosia sp.]